MSHAAQQEFVAKLKDVFPGFFHNAKILEIGSLDLGGTVRDHFNNCDYLGLDVGPGAGVDTVCAGQDYKAPDGSFDAAISLECMEHNPFWKETFLNMARVTKPGGMVLMTCATYGRPEHGTTRTSPEASPHTTRLGWDYYQNLTESDFRREIDFEGLFSAYLFCVDMSFWDLYFFGIRAGEATSENDATKLARIKTEYAVKNKHYPVNTAYYFMMRKFGESRLQMITNGVRALRKAARFS